MLRIVKKRKHLSKEEYPIRLRKLIDGIPCPIFAGHLIGLLYLNDIETVNSRIKNMWGVNLFGSRDRMKRMFQMIIQDVVLMHCQTYSDAVDYLDKIYKLLLKKSADYGPEPIYRYGIRGICDRIIGKVERAKNLMSRPPEVKDESQADTLMDIVGYCLLALLLIEGEL